MNSKLIRNGESLVSDLVDLYEHKNPPERIDFAIFLAESLVKVMRGQRLVKPEKTNK